MTDQKTLVPKLSAPKSLKAPFEGLMLGTAVGDALGLPAEGLSRGRIRKLWKGEWRMRFIFGRGMASDDTEHTLMVAQTLLSNADDADDFRHALARKLRWWLASLPGGVGLATAKACLKLWCGFAPDRSAVESAGSGPAMRSAILGAYFVDDAEKRRAFVRASSNLTHRGWQAETAALAVAEAAACAVSSQSQPDSSKFLLILGELSEEQEWEGVVSVINACLARDDSVSDFAHTLGLEKSVSSYSLHVVPVALYAWLRHYGDFRTALIAALECGGDTDTVGAIVGALSGASCGPEEIPQEWITKVAEWPRSIAFMKSVAKRLAEQKLLGRPLGDVRYFWPGLLFRNVLFVLVVMLQAFRRLLPPY